MISKGDRHVTSSDHPASHGFLRAFRVRLPCSLRVGAGLQRTFDFTARFADTDGDLRRRTNWDLGQLKDALTAFRKSVAVPRQVFTRAPAIRQNRIILSRCYEQLIYREGLRGNRAEVVAALREQEKLWPEEPGRLLEMSRNYAKLAAAVGQGREKLSREEQTERQRYLDESTRLERSARMAEGLHH
jgi:hypothetical protein